MSSFFKHTIKRSETVRVITLPVEKSPFFDWLQKKNGDFSTLLFFTLKTILF